MTRPVSLDKCPVMVLPISKATLLLQAALEKELGVKLMRSSGHLNVNGMTMVTQVLGCDAFQLDLIFGHGFPFAAPVALYSRRLGGQLMDAEPLELPWSVTCFEVDALSRKLTPIIIGKAKETSHATT